jgi:hypothetical protein
MRTPILLSIVALALAAPAAAGNNHEFAAGSGIFATTVSGQAMHFTVSAHRDADGSVSGHVTYHNVNFPGTGKGRAEVVCMSVEGNRATIVAEFKGESPFGEPPLTDFALLVLEDNGKMDRAFAGGISGEVGAPPPVCPPDTSTLPLTPIDKGNVVVRDMTG